MRSQIRSEMAGISPLDEEERSDIAQALAWVDSGAELCRLAKPATPPMHLVSYFVVAAADQVLLVDHRNAQRWLPPGGHVEPDEHPRDTVLRELQEELGFAAPHPIAPPLLLTCSTTLGLTTAHTDVSLWYLVRCSRSQPLLFDAAEFHSVRWFAWAEVPQQRCEPHLPRFLAKLKIIGI